jgi:hypothetical protein
MPDGTFLIQLFDRKGKTIATFSAEFDQTLLIGVVTGLGTPGAIPLWNGIGSLTDSHIRDTGNALSTTEPFFAVGGTGTGVTGTTTSNALAGVVGVNQDATVGGVGVLGQGFGPHGTGVSGQSNDMSDGSTTGVFGSAPFGIGVLGISTSSAGVVGSSAVDGVQGVTTGNGAGAGVHAVTKGTNPALFASGQDGATGDAGDFTGRVLIIGDLIVEGNAYKTGGGSWSFLSDRRVKKSIEPINGALNDFLKLRGVTFEYSNPSAVGELPGTHIGMVAQDVEQVFPSWVDAGVDGYKRLTFRGFEAVAVEAVRELAGKTNDAGLRIAELERQNAELRHAIDTLSEIVKALQQR